MKTKTTIREQLGTTQEEMAMVLGISMSTWSMYESGLRELPAHASQTLADMLVHMQSKSRPSDVVAGNKPDPLVLAQIDQLLRKNEFEQLRLARQIEKFESKQDIINKRARLRDFLNDQKQKAKGPAPQLLHNKKYREDHTASVRSLALARKQAMLTFEKSWLEQQRSLEV